MKATTKAKLVGLLMLFGAAPAVAQDTPAPPDLKEYSLTLTPAEIQYIATALQARPFNEVAGLLNKIQGQIDEQRKAASTTSPAPTEPTK